MLKNVLGQRIWMPGLDTVWREVGLRKVSHVISDDSLCVCGDLAGENMTIMRGDRQRWNQLLIALDPGPREECLQRRMQALIAPLGLSLASDCGKVPPYFRQD